VSFHAINPLSKVYNQNRFGLSCTQCTASSQATISVGILFYSASDLSRICFNIPVYENRYIRYIDKNAPICCTLSIMCKSIPCMV